MDLVFNGAATPHEEISRLLDEADGGRLTIRGEHVITGTVKTRATNLTVDFGDDGKLILAEGLSIPAFVAQPAALYTGSLRMLRPRFDCSRGRKIGGTLSSSAICPSLYARLEIEDCDLYGGEREDQHADSGISPLGILSGHIRGGIIEGFGDLGIYVTGKYTTTNPTLVPHDEDLLIENVHIKNCRGGIDAKRHYKHVTVKDCLIEGAGVAIRMSWVGTDPGEAPVGPGLRMDVIGGKVKKCRQAFTPDGGAVLNIDGTKVVKCEELAMLKGGTIAGNCVIKKTGNVIRERTFTIAGVTYPPKNELRVKDKTKGAK